MKKLMKQLLSLGLSVVTVAGMVSPVLADDDVNTPKSQTESTEVSNEPSSSVDDKTNVQQDDQTETTTSNESNVQKEEQEAQKTKTITVNIIRNGQDSGNKQSYSVPSDYSDEEIKYFIEERIAEDNFVSVEKLSDTEWVLNIEDSKSDNEQYNIILNKDGVEITQTINVSNETKHEYGGIDQYLKINVVPDGYHIDYNKGNGVWKGICSIGSNTFRIYLKKDAEKTESKKFTVKILKSSFSGDDLMENSGVEYHTFEYNGADTTGIEDYIIKKFTPKGYCIMFGPVAYDIYKIDDSTYAALAGRIVDSSTSEDNVTGYMIHYVDQDGNEIDSQSVTLVGDKKETIKSSDLYTIPKGYEFNGDIFKVSNEKDEISGYKVIVNVKKGEYKVPATLNFYKNVNGNLVKFKTIKANAQDLDTDKDNIISRDELKALLPKGYKFSSLSYTDDTIYYGWENLLDTKVVMGVYLEELSTIKESTDSKKSTVLKDMDANEILSSSLDKKQKEKYEEAVAAGKEIVFNPVEKQGISRQDEQKLNEYVSENSVKSVKSFDITIEMLIDGDSVGNISETSSNLKFQIAIPQELKKEGRKFYVLRLHDGKVDTLPVSEDGTFETNKFSSYMLVYEDVTPTKPDTGKKDEGNTENPSNSNNQSNVGQGTSQGGQSTITSSANNATKNTDKKTNKKASGVNTGVKTSSTLFAGLMGISLASLGIVEVLKRKNK